MKTEKTKTRSIIMGAIALLSFILIRILSQGILNIIGHQFIFDNITVSPIESITPTIIISYGIAIVISIFVSGMLIYMVFDEQHFKWKAWYRWAFVGAFYAIVFLIIDLLFQNIKTNIIIEMIIKVLNIISIVAIYLLVFRNVNRRGTE
jgi:hypothetical protein